MFKSLESIKSRVSSASRYLRKYRDLIIINDGANWVLDVEARELKNIAEKLGIRAQVCTNDADTRLQCVHYTSHFVLNNPEIFHHNNRVSIDYFHGKPDQGVEFDEVFNSLKNNHAFIHRLRVSCTPMRDLAFKSGIDPHKVFLIPIGIDTEMFPLQTIYSKRSARREFGINDDAVVIGSFQKDGVGWGDGLEPKLIKGPDIFISVIRNLKEKFNRIHVLLTGPARGYVKRGLEEMNVPFTHSFVDSYSMIPSYYQALDLYLVTSREEGGPKAILESMSSGVPLVTTRVGQAIDLVTDTVNGFMADVEDVAGLTDRAVTALSGREGLQAILVNGRICAEENSYPSQQPLWERFFDGYLKH